MARIVRGCLTPWPQQEEAREAETNFSVPQQGGQAGATRGKEIACYDPDVDFVIRKTITSQVYGGYPKYATPDDKMIARMLHLPLHKNKLHNKQSAQSVTEHTGEYKKDDRSVYDILDEICKDTDLYPYATQHKPKWYGR